MVELQIAYSDRLEADITAGQAILGSLWEQVEAKAAGQTLLPRERAALAAELLTESQRTELRALLERMLASLQETATEIARRFSKSIVESIVKEEFLAFHASGVGAQETHQKLGEYLVHARSRIVELRSATEKVLFGLFPDVVLADAGIEVNDARRTMVSLGGSFGALGLETKSNDAVASAFAEARQYLAALENEFKQGLDIGTAELSRLQEYDRQNGTDLSKTSMPMLISQPVRRWPRLVDRVVSQAES